MPASNERLTADVLRQKVTAALCPEPVSTRCCRSCPYVTPV